MVESALDPPTRGPLCYLAILSNMSLRAWTIDVCHKTYHRRDFPLNYEHFGHEGSDDVHWPNEYSQADVTAHAPHFVSNSPIHQTGCVELRPCESSNLARPRQLLTTGITYRYQGLGRQTRSTAKSVRSDCRCISVRTVRRRRLVSIHCQTVVPRLEEEDVVDTQTKINVLSALESRS